MASRGELYAELMALLSSNPDGVHDSELKERFADNYAALTPVLQQLLDESRVQPFKAASPVPGGPPVTVWKLVDEEKAGKMADLSLEQKLVYQCIERSGNKGIWTREIKSATQMPQHALTKTLKLLETRQLVKTVKSVTSKSKKLYMLYDVVAAKEITGGPWYTEQSFDTEFIRVLENVVINEVSTARRATVEYIAQRVRACGVAEVELTEEEVGHLVHMLVCDHRLERTPDCQGVPESSRAHIYYRVAKPVTARNALTSFPCGICPVIAKCEEGGIISPSSCVYMAEWLRVEDEF